MKNVRLPSKLLATCMAAVLALPYTAPAVCGALGQVGGEMEMSADPGTDTVRAPDSDGMNCSLNECGVPQAGPVAYAHVLQQVASVGAELPARPSEHPANALLPPIPPPQA